MTDNSDPSQEEKPIEQSQSDSTDEKPLSHQGIHELIVQKIRSLIDTGRLSSVDIDSRVCEQLRSFPNDSTSIESVFDEFNQSDLTGVVNKSTFFCNLIKQWKSRNSQTSNSTIEEDTKAELSNVDASGDVSTKHKPGPDATKLKVNIPDDVKRKEFFIDFFRKFSIELVIKWKSQLDNGNTVVHHQMGPINLLQTVK